MSDDIESLENKQIESDKPPIEEDINKNNSDDSALDQNGTTDGSESSNEDSISVKTDDTDLVDKLRETIAYQQSKLSNLTKLEHLVKDLEAKLEYANTKKDAAIKDKESMVVRYAVSEKNVLKEKKEKETAEKKLAESVKELDILQHRIQSLISEKSRICQILDNKIYDNKLIQQELQQKKHDLTSLETKLKWSQNNLKTELDNHKETQAKLEHLTTKYNTISATIEQVKHDADEVVKKFRTSEENRAHTLEQRVNEQQALLILLKHEKKDREEQLKLLKKELERLQTKQKDMLQENNNLSLKVQHLEKDRSENEQKLSELRGCADQQKQDVIDLQTKSAQLEKLKLQLKHEQDQLAACNEQMVLLKQRNTDLEADMESCRVREAELLLFTQQLTEKNVRLQSEFTSMETRVQQLSCEQSLLKRQVKEYENKTNKLNAKLNEDKKLYTDEIEDLKNKLKDSSKYLKDYQQDAVDQKSENILIKRKFDLSLREINKELQKCHKKLEKFENSSSTTTSSSSSNSSLVSNEIDQQTLIEHIVKLQKISAKKSEKIDFLEEHVNTLVIELQKKTKMLQIYLLKEEKPNSSNKKNTIKFG